MIRLIIPALILLVSCSKEQIIDCPPDLIITKYAGIQTVRSSDLKDTNVTKYEYIYEVANTVNPSEFKYKYYKVQDSLFHKNSSYDEYYDIKKDSTLYGWTSKNYQYKRSKITKDSLIIEYEDLEDKHLIRFKGKIIK